MEEPSNSQTRASLLFRIRDPLDRESWQTFVDTYAPLIYRYCRRKGLQDADAADVGQEVMTEIARCIRSFEYQPERGRFRDWLGLVTHRRLARFFGRARGEVHEPLGQSDDGAASEVDSEWSDEFNVQILRVALERVRPRFEPETWKAFERVWVDGRRAVEVARELGRPIESVYVAKSRVLKSLEAEIIALAEDVPQIVRNG
jgi:RNA polymerase sigma factor (sigma-70 family)